MASPVTVAPVLAPVSLPPPPAFKDLLKLPRDVLEEGFVKDFNVTVENMGSLNNTFTAELTHSGKTASRGSLRVKSEQLDLTLFSDSRIRADVNLPVYPVGTSALKVKLGNELNTDTLDAKLAPTVEVKNETVNFSFAVDSPFSLAVTKAADGTPLREVTYVPHRFTLQSAFRVIPGVFAGFSTLFNSTGKWENAGAKLEYLAAPIVAGVALTKSNNGLLDKNFYFYAPCSTSSRVGLLLNHSNSLHVACAVETALNALTTFKVKADSSPRVGFSLTHRLSTFTKLTGSVVYEGTGHQPTMGLSVSLSDKY
jgi:hypothetical protein